MRAGNLLEEPISQGWHSMYLEQQTRYPEANSRQGLTESMYLQASVERGFWSANPPRPQC